MNRTRAIFFVVIAILFIGGFAIGLVYTQKAVSPQPPLEISAVLGVSLTPKYGSIDLKQSSEPYTFDVTSDGGAIDISSFPKYNDLNAGTCSGFTNATPILRVNAPTAAAELDFYFVSSGGNDATLLALHPDDSLYVCDQNTGAGNTPLKVDFINYGAGTYTVWLASQTSGASVSGKLYVTDSGLGHP